MEKLIRFGSIVSPLIPLICLFIYRKKQPKQNLILGISLCISFVFDVIGLLLARSHKTNAFSNNLYFIIAFPAIMWFYHETLNRRSFKILVRVFTIAFFVLAVTFALVQGLKIINANILTLSSILVTITSLLFVADLNFMDDSKFLNNRFHETNIILNTSLALYYFITIVIFSLSNYIFFHLSVEDFLVVWSFHNTIHIIKNIGVTVAFYLTAKRSQVPTNFQKSTHDHRVEKFP